MGAVIPVTIPDDTIHGSAIASRLAAIVESSDDAIISKTLDGTILTWNRGAERIFGYTADEVIGRRLSLLIPPERADEITSILDRVKAGGRVDHFQTVRRRKDGRDIDISVTISPIRDETGKIVAASKIARDITSQVQATVERDRFFDLSIDPLCSVTLAGYFKRVNPAMCAVLDRTEEALVGSFLLEHVHPSDVDATMHELERLRGGVPTSHFENRVRRADGSFRWLSWRSAPTKEGIFYAVARDVTAEKEARESMRAALREKEVLLQEVHHRVKNNLQVISSLINMQLRTLEGGASRDALEECQTRVQAIALIHEKLYQSKDYARVPFCEYLESLATNVFEMAGTSPGAVALDLDIGSDVALPVDKAIPCGLILNELITNALKHAFPEGRGRISVAMTLRDTEAEVRVKDDGKGLPAGFDLWASQTLGLQLVSTLAEQLDATVDIESRGGASFRVRFPLEVHA